MKRFQMPGHPLRWSLSMLLLAGSAVTAGRIFYARPIGVADELGYAPEGGMASAPIPEARGMIAASGSAPEPSEGAETQRDPELYLNCEADFQTVPGSIGAGGIPLRLIRPDTGLKAAGLSAELTLQIGLPGIHEGVRTTGFDAVLRRPPGMAHGDLLDWMQLLPDGLPQARYADIRPGVDLLLYVGAWHGELVFVYWPGADRFTPRLFIDEASFDIEHGRSRWEFGEGVLIFGEPRKSVFDGGMLYFGDAFYNREDNTLTIGLPPLERVKRDRPLVERNWRLIPGSGQPGGPEYGFYMSRYPVTNADFVEFLNDAQAHPDSLRGRHMFYDQNGDVWINPEMRAGEHELFSVANSVLEYEGGAPTGRRYRVTADAPPAGHSYSNHPVTGVSWFGAVKYCNWLTLRSGRGAEALCYREGTNRWDWAPVTSHPTNWVNGRFTTSERYAWLNYNGYRLPMDNTTGRVSRAGIFNEYYKAAAWNGVTNVAYGFGRNAVSPLDANYRGTALQSTTPVGYFDGETEIMGERTSTNRNLYGIYDLSGNVGEWLSCPVTSDLPDARNRRGGAWATGIPRNDQRGYAPPQSADVFGGFRLASMAADLELLIVRIPYRICLLDIEPEEPPVDPPVEPYDAFQDIPVITPPVIRDPDPLPPPPPPPPPLPPPPPPCPALI